MKIFDLEEISLLTGNVMKRESRTRLRSHNSSWNYTTQWRVITRIFVLKTQSNSSLTITNRIHHTEPSFHRTHRPTEMGCHGREEQVQSRSSHGDVINNFILATMNEVDCLRKNYFNCVRFDKEISFSWIPSLIHYGNLIMKIFIKISSSWLFLISFIPNEDIIYFSSFSSSMWFLRV